MSRKLSAMLMLGSTALVTSGLVSPGEAARPTVVQTALYDFCALTSCHDGSAPQGTLLKSGNLLYGVTRTGGTSTSTPCGGVGCGVAFQYNISTGVYKVLYDFCTTLNFNNHCSDGQDANGGLIIDSSGNLYGTTFLGGLTNAGQVYELVKPSGSGLWTFSLVHNFTANSSTDGNGPHDGLSYVGQASSAYDGSSQLWGETIVGGGGGVGNQGYGTVFSLKKISGSWQEKMLFAFGCSTCTAGNEPYGGVVVDSTPNLWGTTLLGGSNGDGVGFELSPSGDPWTGTWFETVLYNFCWNNATNCPSGEFPNGVTMNSTGDLIGTAGGGDANGDGVLFKLYNGSCTEGGTQTFWCNTTLHTFTFAQGSQQNGNVVIDGSGNIFGTAAVGGSTALVTGGAGTIWEQGASFTTLHKFCPNNACADGQYPAGGPILDSSGNLYGVTSEGGDAKNGDGVLFETTP